MEKIQKETKKIEEGMDNNNEQSQKREISNDAKKAALEKLKNTKIGIVNVHELAEAEAHKAADDYMTKSSKEKVNIFKRIWKHTFFDEYYRQREMNRVKKEIKDNDNIYIGRNVDKQDHKDAMNSISERFISDYEGTLSKGEEKKILSKEDKNSEIVRNGIKDLIIKYANGSLNDNDFNTEKLRLLGQIKDEDLLKGSENYADNLLEIAQNAKLAIEHGAKIEELELNTNIIIGKAKSSLKTEAHFNFVDKVVDKMKKSPVGKFVSPATLALATGIAYSASVGLGKKFMNTKLAAWGTFGATVAVSTLLMGANESHRIAEERKQHGLEMAEGGTFMEGDEKREKINRYQYQMEKSSDLSNSLRGLIFEKDKDGNDIPKEIKQEDADKILSMLANIEARNSLNSKNKIDLISYSNIGNVEKERTELTILAAKAKVALRKKIEGDFAGNFNNEKFDDILNKQSRAIEDALLGGEEGINEKDKAFRKYKARRVAWKMTKTAISGLIIGGTIQEVVSWFRDDIQGISEALLHRNENANIQTPLEHIREWISGNPSHVGMENAFPFNINGHEFNLPEGTDIIQNNDGTFNISRNGNIVSDHINLTFDSSGALDQESIVRLGEDGIVASASCSAIETSSTVTVPANEYLEHHPENIHEMVRDRWMGNDTPMYEDPNNPGHLLGADLNEIKGQWGGINGTGIDENGNVVLDHTRMTPYGSFHQEFSTDVLEKMQEGKMFIACSLSEDTQGKVFYFPIGADGKAIIDPTSETGKLFFSTENGHAVFKGKYAEVVELLGSKDGKDHVAVISTLIGPGNNSIEDTISQSVDMSINNLELPKDMEMPYFIPITGRRPLEKIKHKQNTYKDKNPTSVIPQEGEKTNESDIEGPVVIPIIDKDEKQKTLNEISQEEYSAMKDDLKMINKRIRESKGIITLNESDFKSKYGKKRYVELKSIEGGMPVRFNKDELQTIGNEMENYLTNNQQKTEDHIKTDKENTKDQGAEKNKNDRLDLIGPDGKPINQKNNKVEILDKEGKPIKSEKNTNENLISIKEDNIETKEKDNEEKEEEEEGNETEENKEEEEGRFSSLYLEKIGTEFESRGGRNFKIKKIIKGKGLFGFLKPTIIETTMKDETGKEIIVSYKLSDLQNELIKENIKIKEVEK